MPKAVRRRILLKLSGESLMGKKEFGIDEARLRLYAQEIVEVATQNVQIAIVIGGGNIMRGAKAVAAGIDRTTGDHMGMLATLINSLALQSAIESFGISTRIQSAIKMEQIAEPFIIRRATRHLEKGRVLIFAAGTGNPFFTTDTAAALRANEIEADMVLKGTRVDGIYTADPEKDAEAQLFSKISFADVISGGYEVMDQTAFTLCHENNMPILVFNMEKPGTLMKAVTSPGSTGTFIDPDYRSSPVMFTDGALAKKGGVAKASTNGTYAKR